MTTIGIELGLSKSTLASAPYDFTDWLTKRGMRGVPIHPAS